jgi:hypothetical protein
MIRSHIKVSRTRLLVLPLLGVLLAVLSACDQRPQVTLEGGTLPVLKVTGRGAVQLITISGPDFENPNSGGPGSRYMKPFWQIVPESDYDIAHLESLGGIAYGQVPKGFKQVIPENGAEPQPLMENELFTIDLRLANGEAVGHRFVIHNGKVAVEGS